jgi:Holliday junction resolvasome RuvABC endonuclease subunit
MIVLSLDPGSCTGYCLVSVEWEYIDIWSGTWKWTSADIYEYGYINVDITSNYQGDHCIDLMNKIKDIIDRHNVEHITVEDFFFSKKFANGSNVNVAFRTAIHILARERGIDYTILNISAWKTFVAGRATPTKQQKMLWGPTPAKKIYMQDALWMYFSIRFPNHSISEKTRKPIVFKYDIVDVVAQAIYYCGLVLSPGAVPLENISCSVEIPEDVVMKTTKKVYVYKS